MENNATRSDNIIQSNRIKSLLDLYCRINGFKKDHWRTLIIAKVLLCKHDAHTCKKGVKAFFFKSKVYPNVPDILKVIDGNMLRPEKWEEFFEYIEEFSNELGHLEVNRSPEY